MPSWSVSLELSGTKNIDCQAGAEIIWWFRLKTFWSAKLPNVKFSCARVSAWQTTSLKWKRFIETNACSNQNLTPWITYCMRWFIGPWIALNWIDGRCNNIVFPPSPKSWSWIFPPSPKSWSWIFLPSPKSWSWNVVSGWSFVLNSLRTISSRLDDGMLRFIIKNVSLRMACWDLS